MGSQRGACIWQIKDFFMDRACVFGTYVWVNMHTHHPEINCRVFIHLYSCADEKFLNNSPLSCIIEVFCGLVSVEVPKACVIPSRS